ncbi:MAG: hypothetical protein RIQ93_312, partial [Verrucomicrobiota bacterium]
MTDEAITMQSTTTSSTGHPARPNNQADMLPAWAEYSSFFRRLAS